MSSDPKPAPRKGSPGPNRDCVPLIDWAAQAGAVGDVLNEVEYRLRRRRARLFRTTAVAIVAVAAGIFTWNAIPGRNTEAVPAAANKLIVSLPSRQELPDGSTIELREGAKLTVDFSASARRVTLQQGEAHFQVAKDPARPFVVTARGLSVSAVGTAFSVEAGAETTAVLVTEGRVAVGRSATLVGASGAVMSETAARPVAVLDAGKRLVLGATASPSQTPEVHTVSSAELSARLAWRVPRLDFAGTALGEIVPVINRHSRLQLILGDSGLENIRVSGTLRADNAETLVGLLEDGHGIRVERRSATEIVLYAGR